MKTNNESINYRDTYHNFDTHRGILEYYNRIDTEHFLNYDGNSINVVNTNTGNAPNPMGITSEPFHLGIRRIETGDANALSYTIDSYYNDQNSLHIIDQTIYVATWSIRIDKHDPIDTWRFWCGFMNDKHFNNSTRHNVLLYDYNNYNTNKLIYNKYDGTDYTDFETDISLSETEKQWYIIRFYMNTHLNELTLYIGENMNKLKGVYKDSGIVFDDSFGLHIGIEKDFGNSVGRTIDIDYFSLHNYMI